MGCSFTETVIVCAIAIASYTFMALYFKFRLLSPSSSSSCIKPSIDMNEESDGPVVSIELSSMLSSSLNRSNSADIGSEHSSMNSADIIGMDSMKICITDLGLLSDHPFHENSYPSKCRRH